MSYVYKDKYMKIKMSDQSNLFNLTPKWYLSRYERGFK